MSLILSFDCVIRWPPADSANVFVVACLGGRRRISVRFGHLFLFLFLPPPLLHSRPLGGCQSEDLNGRS